MKKTEIKNPLQPMEDQPAKPVYIKEQQNHNCQQFYGPVTGCVFAMPGAVVNQYPNGAAPKATSAPTENATRNPQLCKDSILEYVMKLHPFLVREEWRDKYKELWEEILELPEVAKVIYDKGRQQKTTFNRNLVGNILHLMKERKIFVPTTHATELAKTLEGDTNASIRAKLGELPPKEVKDAIEILIKSIIE